MNKEDEIVEKIEEKFGFTPVYFYDQVKGSFLYGENGLQMKFSPSWGDGKLFAEIKKALKQN